MTEKVDTYKFSLAKFFLNAFFPLIIILGHIVLITIIAPSIDSINFFVPIMFFVILPGFLSIPSAVISINFLKKTIGSTVSITEKTIALEKDGLIYELEKSRISKIIKIGHDEKFSRVPWLFMEHIVIREESGRSIVISSFMANTSKLLNEMRFDRTLNSVEISEENSIFELIE